MAFLLERSESLSRGTVGVLSELFQNMITEISDNSLILDDRIHNTRTNVKKCRAMLRLLRFQLNENVYEFENKTLRDLGRLLADSRDSYILIETVNLLKTLYPDNLVDLSPLMEQLNRNYKEHLCYFKENNVLQTVVNGLHDLKKRTEQWSIKNDDNLFWEGLKKIYNNGREHMSSAFSQKDDILMHEWRKEVKYIWYQLLVLSGFNRLVMDDLAEQFHVLSGYLGIDHDLLELNEYLENMRDNGPVSAIGNLFNVISLEKERLQTLAAEKGKVLFADDPDLWIDKLKGIVKGA